MKPTQALGVINITAEAHHAIRALSASGMKDLAVSPLRYWYRHIHGAAKDQEETAAMRVGTALHSAVLEPERFADQYGCAFDPSTLGEDALNTVADIRAWIEARGFKPKGTAKWPLIGQALELMQQTNITVPIVATEEAAHAAFNEGKTILSVDEWTRVNAMAARLREEPEIQRLTEQGRPETTILAEDPDTGVLLKARLDWMATNHTLDLKTFVQKRGNSIDKSICDAIYYERYYVQAYFYTYVRKIAGLDSVPFIMAFVESTEPHDIRIRELAPSSLGETNIYWEQARLEVRRMIRLYAECQEKYGDSEWRDHQRVDPLTNEDIQQFRY